MNLGREILDNIFEAMMIDAEWSTRDSNSFTWWGHRLAQRVTADAPRSDHGFEIVRVRAETDVLADVPHEPQLAQKLALLNSTATMNAYVWHPDRETVSLACSIYAHEENLRYSMHLAKAAVAMQAADAHLKAEGLTEFLGGRPDESQHPSSGQRHEPDDMLNAVAMFARSGRGISLYGPDLAEINAMLAANGILATEGQFGMTAEFACIDDNPAALGGTGTALFQLETMTPHPQVGSGALMTLKLPPRWPAATAAYIACDLNRAEAAEGAFVRAHLLGAWCVAPDDGRVTYAAFLPTQLHGYGLLMNIVVSIAMRSRWAGEFLGPHLDRVDGAA